MDELLGIESLELDSSDELLGVELDEDTSTELELGTTDEELFGVELDKGISVPKLILGMLLPSASSNEQEKANAATNTMLAA